MKASPATAEPERWLLVGSCLCVLGRSLESKEQLVLGCWKGIGGRTSRRQKKGAGFWMLKCLFIAQQALQVEPACFNRPADVVGKEKV